MKKQSTGILEILSNTEETCISKNLSNVEKSLYSQISLSSTQESFLEKLIQYLPNIETRNSLENISNVQETWISKILPIPTQCGYIRSIGGGAAN